MAGGQTGLCSGIPGCDAQIRAVKSSGCFVSTITRPSQGIADILELGPCLDRDRCKRDVFARVIQDLQIRLDKKGLIDWDLWCVDGASVRAARAAAGADKKVSAATRANPKTTLWAAAEAGLDPSSTWLLTARELRSPRK